MVGNAILRKVVRANLGGSVTGANCGLSHARARGFLLGELMVQKA
jgi:hypothetical protein